MNWHTTGGSRGQLQRPGSRLACKSGAAAAKAGKNDGGVQTFGS